MHVLKAEADDIFCGTPPLAFTSASAACCSFRCAIGAATLLLEQATPPHLLRRDRALPAPRSSFTAPTAYRAMHGMLAQARRVEPAQVRAPPARPCPRATFEACGSEATGIQHHRRHRRDRDAAHLHQRRGRRDPARAPPGKVGARLRGQGRRRRGARSVPPARWAAGGAGPDRLPLPRQRSRRQRTYVQNGWNLTGDSYVQDEDGYYWYQARTDDMIISAGYNIAGPEVEDGAAAAHRQWPNARWSACRTRSAGRSSRPSWCCGDGASRGAGAGRRSCRTS